MLKNSSHLNTRACHLYAFECVQSSLCDEVCRRAIVSVCHHNSNQCDAASALFSPHRPAGRRVAACLTAHCACPRHLPWLLDVGGGEGLQQGREDPSGNSGRAGKETNKEIRWVNLNYLTFDYMHYIHGLLSVPNENSSNSWYQMED